MVTMSRLTGRLLDWIDLFRAWAFPFFDARVLHHVVELQTLINKKLDSRQLIPLQSTIRWSDTQLDIWAINKSVSIVLKYGV